MAAGHESITVKLNRITIFATGLVILLASAGLIAFDTLSQKRTGLEYLAVLAGVVANNVAPSVASGDRNEVLESLATSIPTPNGLFTCVYDNRSELFASRLLPTNNAAACPATLEDAIASSSLSPYLVWPIILDGAEVGMLYFEVTSSSTALRFPTLLAIILAVITFPSLVAFAIASGRQKAMTEPIRKFSEAAKKVIEEEDYSFRAEKVFEDEIGDITESFNKALATIQDTKSEIARSDYRLQRTLETMFDGFMIFSENGLIENFNSSAETLFQYDRDEVVGQNVSLLFSDQYRESMRRYFEVLSPEERREFCDELRESVGRRKDGSTFPMTFAIGEMEVEGDLSYAGIIRDITDEKLVEAKLIDARDTADSANQAKSSFIANTSHELRTPLNSIIGFSELIISKSSCTNGDSTNHEYATEIKKAGRHLLEVINDILDLSKIEAGDIELHEEVVDPQDVVASALALVKERAYRSGVEINVNVARVLLRLDERKFKQILLNLFSNAIKFTPHGGTVSVVGWARAESGYVLQVKDTGMGIAADDIPKALTTFGQVDSDLSRKFDGTGLGLPLTKSLVELHGGSFDLQSELGVGTIATARFPADRIVTKRTVPMPRKSAPESRSQQTMTSSR